MPVKILRELKLKVRKPIVHADDENPVEDIKAAEEAKASVASGAGYALMNQASTYAQGVHALRDACDNEPNCVHPTFVMKDGSSVYRPLTFEENIRARLEDYNTLHNPDGNERSDDDRLRLFNTWLDSCTGIAYKKGTTLFKIITESEDLIHIGKGFNGDYIPVRYSQMQGAEFDSSQGTDNRLLTLNKVLNLPAWNEAVTDKALLNEYAKLVFRLNNGNNMGFWVRKNISQDELRELCVGDLILYYSNAYGGNLFNGGRFVRATHRAPQAP